MWSVNHGHTVTPGERVVRRGKVITSLPEEQFDMNMKERLVDILDKLKLALILLAGGVSIVPVKFILSTLVAGVPPTSLILTLALFVVETFANVQVPVDPWIVRVAVPEEVIYQQEL